MEKEKNALEGEKNKAVEFLTLENDIFKHKSQLCQYYVWVHHLSAQDKLNNNIIWFNFNVDSHGSTEEGGWCKFYVVFWNF